MKTEPTDAAPAAALSFSSGFRRELTPTWLSFACLLNGHRPPDLGASFRYVHVGCGNGKTTAVIGAVHPDADVWAWADRSGDLENTARTCRSAGLSNVRVHERVGLPPDLGGDVADLIVVEGVLTTASDEWRSELFDAVGDNLRPGGLACITYRTTVSWSEIAPVQRVMHRVAERHAGHPDDLVPAVLSLMDELRKGGARHLTERPVVAAWLDELKETDPAVIVRDYLQGAFRPMSHPQVAGALSAHGCTFVGSAMLDGSFEFSPELAEVIDAAPSPALREAYRDLATRPSERMDLFRRGGAPLAEGDRQAWLDSVDLVPISGPEADRLGGTPSELRQTVGALRAHPASVYASAGAAEQSRALGQVFADSGIDLVPVSVIGSALPLGAELTIPGGPEAA